MFDGLIQGSKTFLRVVVKAVLGMIVVPLGIFISEIKPDWEEAGILIKTTTGILLVPIVIFLTFAAPWWEDFEIEG